MLQKFVVLSLAGLALSACTAETIAEFDQQNAATSQTPRVVSTSNFDLVNHNCLPEIAISSGAASKSETETGFVFDDGGNCVLRGTQQTFTGTAPAANVLVQAPTVQQVVQPQVVSVPQQVVTQPLVTQPLVAQPVVAQQVVGQPVIGQPRTTAGGLRIISTTAVVPVATSSVSTTSVSSSGRFTIQGTSFAQDSDRLLSTAVPQLDSVASQMLAAGGSYNIIGYASQDGASAHNKSLSQRRAQTVAGYLVSKGVAGGKLTVSGWGETTQFGSSADANRRVEISRIGS